MFEFVVNFLAGNPSKDNIVYNKLHNQQSIKCLICWKFVINIIAFRYIKININYALFRVRK